MSLSTRTLQVIILLVGAVGSARTAAAATLVDLSDCTGACGTPTQQEVTTFCANKGTCPQGTYNWGTGNCYATITQNPQPKGQWTGTRFSSQDLDNCHTCAGNCQAISANISLGEERKDEASTEFGGTFGGTLKGSISNALLGGIETTVSAEFRAGQTNTSAITQSTTYTGTLTGVPCCGYKKQHIMIWQRDEPSQATIALQLSAGCTWNNQQCWTGGVIKQCNKTAALTSKNVERSAAKTCDVTCTSMHQNCAQSATTTPTDGCPISPPAAS